MRILPLILGVALALSGVAVAADPFNYARQWNGWSSAAKNAYLEGLREGIIFGSTRFHINYAGTDKLDLKSEEGQRVQRALKHTVLYFENDSLTGIIDALYGDPGNSFVPHVQMVVLAEAKLKGESIEDALALARRTAVQIHELEQSQGTR